MPDALSKTVPIWCAVINLAIQLRSGIEWDTELYLPASIVSPSERAQIAAQIPNWARSLQVGRLA
jgi:tRNA A64-2'-O-ribosylphosphate transferase